MSSYTDLMQMCRLCLVKEQVNLPIFDGQGELQQIFLKITACLPVKVSREDNLPKSICDGCSYKLDLLYQFWNTSSNSEKQLIDWLTAAGVDPKHTSNEPIGLAGQSDVILKQEPVTELDAISSDAQNYIIQQQQLAYKPEEYEESQQNAKSTKNKAVSEAGDEPSPKRPRRATRNSKSVREDDSDDDYVDTTVTDITKTEDDTEDDDDDDDGEGDDMGDDGDDMGDPDFVANEEDTEQPGPSGVGGAKASSGPSQTLDKANYESLKSLYGLKECIVFLGNPTEFDQKLYRYMKTQAICDDVDQSNIVSSARLKYKCDLCTAKFRDYYRLTLHIEEEHDVEGDRSSVSSQSSAELYEPDIVDDDSQSGVELSESEETVREEKTSIQKKETQNIESTSQVKAEEEVQEESVTPPDEDEVIMWEQPNARKKCLKCMRVFIDKGHYAEHLKVVHNVFGCMLCPQAFYSEVNFEAHLKKVHHNGSEKWRCSICNLSFTDFWHLSEHNFAVHRPMCNLCSREFPDVKSLIQHKVQRHTVEKSLICKDCGLTLPDSQSLNDHSLQHGYIHYTCELCNESYTSKVGYLDHMAKKHVGKEPSPRVLHLDKRYNLNTKSSINILPRLLSQPSVSRTKSTVPQTIASTAVTGTNSAVPATTSSMKVAIPRLQARPNTVFSNAVSTSVVQIQNPVTGLKEHKVLVMEKNSNKAYMVPAMMINQNGQIKYVIHENAVREQVTINNAIASAPQPPTQPTSSIQPASQPIASLPITQPIKLIQPTIANPIGAAVVPPVVSSVVHPTVNPPSLLIPSLPNTSTVRPNTMTIRYANNSASIVSPKLAMPPKMVPPLQGIRLKTTSYLKRKIVPYNPLIQPKIVSINSSAVSTPSNKVAIPSLKKYGKQYIAKKVPIAPRLVQHTERQDVIEQADMPKLEIQSVVGGSSAVARVLNTPMDKPEIVGPEEAAPTLIAESGDAERPKIFLKPLSQLLKKSKESPTSEDTVVDLDADTEPSTSASNSINVSSSNVRLISGGKSKSMGYKLAKSTDGSNDMIYKCNYCSFRFKKLSKVLQHQSRVKCKLCEYIGCFRAMDAHYKEKHDLEFQCMTCDAMFDGVKSLRDHNKTKHFCMKCRKFFMALSRHQAVHVCFMCSTFTCTAIDLMHHYELIHDSPHVCTYCKIVFPGKLPLHEHKMEVHFCNNCRSLKANMKLHSCNKSK